MLKHEVNEKGSALYTHFMELIEDSPESNGVMCGVDVHTFPNEYPFLAMDSFAD